MLKNSSELNRIKEDKGYSAKLLSILKSGKIDFHISQSLYLYRIKFILDKYKKKKCERKSTIFDSNNIKEQQNFEEIIPKIFKMFDIDGQIVILSLFLLEKAIFKSKIFLDKINLIKFVVISLVETIKFNNDEPDTGGKLICSILRIDNDTLINLELKFLGVIDYKLNPDEDKYFAYKQKILVLWIDYLKSLL